MKSFMLNVFSVCVSQYQSYREEKAATAIEYALIAGGIALAIVAVVFTLGDEVSTIFQDVEDGLDGP